MKTMLIVVADAKRARFFKFVPGATAEGGPKLIERAGLFNPDVEGARTGGFGRVKTERVSNRQAGDVHPIEPRRLQHRLELERRFGREIARLASRLANAGDTETVMLIADPRLLGLMREDLRESLKASIELKALARDYTQFTPRQLLDRLYGSRVVPALRSSAT